MTNPARQLHSVATATINQGTYRELFDASQRFQPAASIAIARCNAGRAAVRMTYRRRKSVYGILIGDVSGNGAGIPQTHRAIFQRRQHRLQRRFANQIASTISLIETTNNIT